MYLWLAHIYLFQTFFNILIKTAIEAHILLATHGAINFYYNEIWFDSTNQKLISKFQNKYIWENTSEWGTWRTGSIYTIYQIWAFMLALFLDNKKTFFGYYVPSLTVNVNERKPL